MEEHRSELQLPVPGNNSTEPAKAPSAASSRPTQQQLRKEQRRQRRLEVYEKVVELNRLGHSHKAIAEELKLQRKTIRRWLRAREFPERKMPVRRPPAVEEYADYLQQRWNQGCHNATGLVS